MGQELLVITAVVGGAATIPFVARRVSVPSAIFEIIYGVVLFSFLLHERPEWFVFLKEVGLIYLMFIAGMELDLRGLIREGRFLWYFLLSAVPFAAMPYLFVQIGYPYYFGVAVSVMSAGVIIPVLKESGLIRTPLGRDAVGFALTGEFLSIIAILGIGIYHSYGVTPAALLSVAKLLVFFLLAVLFLKFLYLLAWWTPEKVERVMESEDPVEEGIRAIIFVAMAGALIASGAGVEPILGSFIAGVIFSHVFKSKGRFEEKINAVGFGFFTPFFFIGVGAEFDVGLLGSAESIGFALVLSLMVLLSNVLPVVLSGPMKAPLLASVAVALLLSAPLTMMVVAGTLGLRMGLIDTSGYNALVLASIVSCVLFPSLFRPIGKAVLKGLAAKEAR